MLLQVAVRYIGQLTEIEPKMTCSGPRPRSLRDLKLPRGHHPGLRGAHSVRLAAGDGDHGPRAQVDAVAVPQRHCLAGGTSLPLTMMPFGEPGSTTDQP